MCWLCAHTCIQLDDRYALCAPGAMNKLCFCAEAPVTRSCLKKVFFPLSLPPSLPLTHISCLAVGETCKAIFYFLTYSRREKKIHRMEGTLISADTTPQLLYYLWFLRPRGSVRDLEADNSQCSSVITYMYLIFTGRVDDQCDKQYCRSWSLVRLRLPR